MKDTASWSPGSPNPHATCEVLGSMLVKEQASFLSPGPAWCPDRGAAGHQRTAPHSVLIRELLEDHGV